MPTYPVTFATKTMNKLRDTVRTMHENGIATCESCDGSLHHSYYAPTVILAGRLSKKRVLEIIKICYENDLRPVRFYKPGYCQEII